MDHYPYTFEPILHRAGWGGTVLEKSYGKRRPRAKGHEPLAESLELSHERSGGHVIDGGPRKGTSLRDILRSDAEGVLGPAVAVRCGREFPLEIRLREAGSDGPLELRTALDAPMEAALPRTAPFAAWYVLQAAPQARLRRGILPGTTQEELQAAARNGTLLEHLNTLPARPGESVFLPPGTLYGLGPGMAVYEVALRGGEWQRLEVRRPGGTRGRGNATAFHRALASLDLRTMGVRRSDPVRLRPAPLRRDLLLRCEGFSIELLRLSKRLVEKADGLRFAALTCVSGAASIRYEGPGTGEIPLPAGRTVLIPARLPGYEIAPDRECAVLKVFME